MRKLTASAVAVVATLLILPMSAAAAASNDTAKGSGTTQTYALAGFPDTAFGPARVSFNATANFNGTEPKGTMQTTIGPDTYSGDVTCVQVFGNAATVSGYIERAQGSETFAGTTATSFTIDAVDNGSSGDQLALAINPTPTVDGCSTPFYGEGAFEQADVVIHDG